jgi:hypothetical protein
MGHATDQAGSQSPASHHRDSGLHTEQFYVKFVWTTWYWKEIFLQFRWYFPVIIIALLLHIHLCTIWVLDKGLLVVAVPQKYCLNPP